MHLFFIKNGGKLSHKDFRISFFEGLLVESNIQQIILHSKYSGKQHYVGQIPDGSRRYCHHCKTKRTTWLCKKCTQNTELLLCASTLL